MQKYVEMAKNSGMIDALIIKPEDICFDIRTQIKCAWGCDRGITPTLRCDNRGTSFEERVQIVKTYQNILLVHAHSAQLLSEVTLELEKAAFMDGHYFATALRACNLCTECRVKKGRDCHHPDKIRPCDSLFGIDMYRTVRRAGLPCEVLQNEKEEQNRYGFVLIN